jgi:hypothetical protein
MTFFEKDFSFINIPSNEENTTSSQSSKSQEHLQLVQNKLKTSTEENPVPQGKSRDLVKSVS